MIEVLGAEASSIPPPSKAVSSDVDNVDLLLRWSEAVKVKLNYFCSKIFFMEIL